MKKLNFIFLLSFFLTTAFFTSIAFSSPVEVTLEDRAYNSLDRLAAMGLVDKVFIDNRPLSREAFTNLLVRLMNNKDLSNSLNNKEKKIFTKEINFLKFKFASELKRLQSDLLLNYQISDPLELHFKYGGLKNGSISYKENSNARIIDDQAGSEWKNSSWFTLYKFGMYGEIWKENRNHSSNIGFNNIYIVQKINRFKISIGKMSQWWGTGRHGTLLLTNNPSPIKLIRLENQKPYNLPFKSGIFKFNAFLGDLGKAMVHPGANLFGLKFSLKFKKFVDIGFARVTMFGGSGLPAISTIDFLRLYMSDPNQSGKFEVNELSSIDFRLRSLKFINTFVDLYGEIGGEDEAGLRPTKLGYVGGIYFPILPFLPFGDLRVEYADNHISNFPNVWYTHTLYTTGYRYEGNIIGHHMGTDSSDLYIATETIIKNFDILRLSFDYERHDLSNDIKETKTEYSVHYIKTVLENMNIVFDYEYELIKNKNLIPGLTQIGHIVLFSYNLIF